MVRLRVGGHLSDLCDENRQEESADPSSASMALSYHGPGEVTVPWPQATAVLLGGVS